MAWKQQSYDSTRGNAGEPRPAAGAPIAILGVPFDNVTTAQTIELIEQMVASKRPHYLATANVDFVVQALNDVELRRILLGAHLVLCDGMPLVWASRLLGNPLPERVTGSDMTPLLLKVAEDRGYRIFLLGSTEESLERAIVNIREKHPRLEIAGSLAPPFKPLLEMDHAGICRVVREARPDILIVAFGCPKQEKWINMHYLGLQVPVSIGVGATIDFMAGTVRRAPRWMRQSGLEWVWRILQEPRRLFGRYMRDLWLFSRAILQQWWQLHLRARGRRTATSVGEAGAIDPAFAMLKLKGRFDATLVRQHETVWQRALASRCHLLLDVTDVQFVDSTGIGLMVRLQKNLQAMQRQLVLVAPSDAIRRALDLMQFTDFLPCASDMDAARQLVSSRISEKAAVVSMDLSGSAEPLRWRGEIMAANAEEVWRVTENYLSTMSGKGGVVTVDLAQLRFVDSTGVSLMVRAKKRAHVHHLELRFSNPQVGVLNVIKTLRLEEYLLGKS